MSLEHFNYKRTPMDADANHINQLEQSSVVQEHGQPCHKLG